MTKKNDLRNITFPNKTCKNQIGDNTSTHGADNKKKKQYHQELFMVHVYHDALVAE